MSKVAWVKSEEKQVFKGRNIRRQIVAVYRNGHDMWDGYRYDVRWVMETDNGVEKRSKTRKGLFSRR
jgi:hypothetical protein